MPQSQRKNKNQSRCCCGKDVLCQTVLWQTHLASVMWHSSPVLLLLPLPQLLLPLLLVLRHLCRPAAQLPRCKAHCSEQTLAQHTDLLPARPHELKGKHTAHTVA
jgi:hypothetical protein